MDDESLKPIQWGHFGLGMLLLLFPGFFVLKPSRLRSEEVKEAPLFGLAKSFGNWADLIRLSAGFFLIHAILLAPPDVKGRKYFALFVPLLCVIPHCITVRARKIIFIAPIPYLFAYTLSVADPLIAAITICFAFIVSALLKNSYAFLPLFCAVLASGTYLIAGVNLQVAVAVLIAVAPALSAAFALQKLYFPLER
jgi:hypothetical protein